MTQKSSPQFDAALKEIPHYQACPLMLPYVGPDYASSGHKKMLLIGESFYFPEDSTIHKDAAKWYQKTQADLNEEEEIHIHCRSLIEGEWRAKTGHEMYREIDKYLRACSPELDAAERATSHIAYTNAFLRPAAERGKSFMPCCTTEDRERSIEVTNAVIKTLQPDLVIYLSKYAWDCVGWQVADLNPSVIFDFTSHPTDPFHWPVKDYPHGREKFIKLLNEQFLA